MKKAALLLTLLIAVAISPLSLGQELAALHIPHERFELDNGLRVIVHTDMSALSVKVSMDYQVGSRDEVPGQRGFAHLFEHLMLMRTEHTADPVIATARQLGGSANGVTSFDRTNYYLAVPYTALEYAVWLEADRMRNFLNVFDEDALISQRGVVKNEMRQRGSRLRDEITALMNAAMLPDDHPYMHPTIGNEADLNAASVAAAVEWFERWYGPNNAVLTLSGRVTASEARALVEKYFGAIEPSVPPHRYSSWIPDRSQNTFGQLYSDDVRTAEIYRAWLMPGNGAQAAAHAKVAADILKGEAFDWLHRELVDELGLANSVGMWVSEYDLFSRVNLRVTLAPDQDIERASRAIDAVLQRFAEKGPSQAELRSHREKQAASYAQGMRGYGSRADWLGFAERSLGSADAVHTYFNWLDTASPADLRNVVRDWFGDGYHQVIVLPANWKATETVVDFSEVPAIDAMPPAKVPGHESTTTDSAVRLYVSPLPDAPLTTAVITVDGGVFMDEGLPTGTSDVLLGMMQHATEKLDAAALNARAERLGATVRFAKSGDQLEVFVITMQSRFDRTLEHVLEMLRSPRLDNESFDEVNEQRSDRLQKLAAFGPMALDVARAELFGEDHPLGGRYMVDAADAPVVTLADVRQAHANWIRPGSLRIYVAGDTSVAAVERALAKPLRGWKTPSGAAAAVPQIPDPARTSASVVLHDSPEASQTQIVIGLAIPKLEGKEAAAFDVLKTRFSGAFDSRLNMNLREDKGWTYGVKGAVLEYPGFDTWVTTASVESGKTVAALEEIYREIEALRGAAPITAAEVESVVSRSIERLNSRFGSAGSRIAGMRALEHEGKTVDELEGLPDVYRSITPADVADVVGRMLDPERMVWVIEGDLEQFEDAAVIEKLGAVRSAVQ